MRPTELQEGVRQRLGLLRGVSRLDDRQDENGSVESDDLGSVAPAVERTVSAHQRHRMVDLSGRDRETKLSLAHDKPVVLGGTIAGAVSALWPAVLAFCAAFDIWDPSDEQLGAISALWVAVIGVVTAWTSKTAASRVWAGPSVAAEVAGRTAVIEAEYEERLRIAESFGRPDQNQQPHTTHPQWGPVGGRTDP